jgi:IcmF-related N-terminal domain
MWHFFQRLGALFRFGQAGSQQAQQQGSRVGGGRLKWRVLHVVLVLVVVVGLFFLNRALHLDRLIPRSPLLRTSWLPILFLLVYLLGWMVWWLWRLVRVDEDQSQFPDIDEAWAEAMTGLKRAGIAVRDVPLFLVLGQPESGERYLFQAAQMSFDVANVPSREDAPVRIHANRDGIYVTCAGASVLGVHAAVLVGRLSLVQKEDRAGEDDMVTINPFLAGEPGAAAIPAIGKIAALADRQGRGLSPAERRQIRGLHRRDNPQTSLLRHPEKMEFQVARLKHLCRLIVRDRAPYCPVNGILVLIPFAGTDHDQDAADTGVLCQTDLAAARSVLRVHCPVFALVCDFETMPGFEEFVKRFSARERLNRLGQRSPLAPDFLQISLDGKQGAEFSALLEDLADWVCTAVMPAWVYRTFDVEEQSDPDHLEASLQKNAQLFLLISELAERQRFLARILTRGLGIDAPAPPLFGGCYLAGTGTDPQSQQGFVAGVLRRLVQEQEAVTWTEAAWAEENWYDRWLVAGWAALGCLVVIGFALLFGPLFYRGGP